MKSQYFIHYFGIIYIMALTVLTSCEKELDLDIPLEPSKLVVEGWIENDKYAEIILSRSAPFFSAIDSLSLLDYAVTHAKVTLFTGDRSEILTLKPNQSYFPPFVYHSLEIKGEAGRTYSIEVVLDGDTIRSVTTIPEPVQLDSVWFEPEPGEVDKGRIWVKLHDNPDEDNYYRILFKRIGKDSRYVPPGLSAFSDVLFNGETVEMGFLRGFSSLIDLENYNYFEKGDTVSVKFCTIDKDQFDFWNVYQNEVLSAGNPLSTGNNILKSNIEGGLGIWSGYGASNDVLIIE